MRFDIDGGNRGEWFLYFDSEVRENGDIKYHDPVKGAGSVCLRQADPEALERIQSQTRSSKQVEHVYNPKTRTMDRVIYYDQTLEQERKERELLWDHVIVEWKDIQDKNGKPIECNTENKLKLMAIPKFARFVGRCLQLITGAEAEQKVASEKN